MGHRVASGVYQVGITTRDQSGVRRFVMIGENDPGCREEPGSTRASPSRDCRVPALTQQLALALGRDVELDSYERGAPVALVGLQRRPECANDVSGRLDRADGGDALARLPVLRPPARGQ